MKLEKVLGQDLMSEMSGESTESLKARIVNANQAMETVKQELEANVKYQELKEQVKAATAGLRDVNKFQKAVIKHALSLLESRG